MKNIKVCENGPYIVTGDVPLKKEIAKVGKEGAPETWKEGEKYPDKKEYSLCRCGKSGNKPFCDGSHSLGFDGKETASRKKFIEQAETFNGPRLKLNDCQALCANARFCHRGGGTWKNVMGDDDKSEKLAVETACNCPSGRLVISDKNGKIIENKYEQGISLVEDPQAGVSGPIWVKGGIPIESVDGENYEARNRVTLCRCGKSNNKPFCDGSHIDAKFNDGDKSVN
jgi:CDGSH-type Zn-finger protein